MKKLAVILAVLAFLAFVAKEVAGQSVESTALITPSSPGNHTITLYVGKYYGKASMPLTKRNDVDQTRNGCTAFGEHPPLIQAHWNHRHRLPSHRSDLRPRIDRSLSGAEWSAHPLRGCGHSHWQLDITLGRSRREAGSSDSRSTR